MSFGQSVPPVHHLTSPGIHICCPTDTAGKMLIQDAREVCCILLNSVPRLRIAKIKELQILNQFRNAIQWVRVSGGPVASGASHVYENIPSGYRWPPYKTTE